MYLFGIVAMCFAIYGMSKVDKALVKKAWSVVDEVSDYTLNVTGTLDHLLDTISNASAIIDDFQTVVNVTMDISGMQANLVVSGSWLIDQCVFVAVAQVSKHAGARCMVASSSVYESVVLMW